MITICSTDPKYSWCENRNGFRHIKGVEAMTYTTQGVQMVSFAGVGKSGTTLRGVIEFELSTLEKIIEEIKESMK